MPNFKVQLPLIKAFAFDMDGVLTNGEFLALSNGDLLRHFYAKDGFAIRTALAMQFPVAIITGGFSESINRRFSALGVTDIITQSRNKLPDFYQFCEKHDIKPSEVLYMGDDIPDIPILSACGLPCCPKDSAKEVIAFSQYVSPYPGGRGCVRDIIEQVLRSQGKWYITAN